MILGTIQQYLIFAVFKKISYVCTKTTKSDGSYPTELKIGSVVKIICIFDYENSSLILPLPFPYDFEQFGTFQLAR